MNEIRKRLNCENSVFFVSYEIIYFLEHIASSKSILKNSYASLLCFSKTLIEHQQ